MEKFIVV